MFRVLLLSNLYRGEGPPWNNTWPRCQARSLFCSSVYFVNICKDMIGQSQNLAKFSSQRPYTTVDPEKDILGCSARKNQLVRPCFAGRHLTQIRRISAWLRTQIQDLRYSRVVHTSRSQRNSDRLDGGFSFNLTERSLKCR